MKRTLLLLVGTLLFFPLFAQKNSKQARVILDRVADKARNGEGYGVKFSALTYMGDQLQGMSEGSLIFKDDKFTCETEQMKTWFDGKTQWSLIYDSEEVNITEPTPEELIEINPYALLKLYKKGYSYYLLSEKQIDGVSFAEIVLEASSNKNDLQKLTLWINAKTNEPHTIDIVRSNGDTIHINIELVRVNKNLSPNIFVFNEKAYPNVDVIDLR